LIGTNASTCSLLQAKYTNDAVASVITGYKSRGTTAGSHGIVLNSDAIIRYEAYADDGVKDMRMGRMSFLVPTSGTIGVDRIPGRWLLELNDTSATSVLSSVIDANTTNITITPTLIVSGNIRTNGSYNVAGVQVVTARKSGWAVATGTSDRTAFDTETVALNVLARHVKALVDDLYSTSGHGLIGA